MPEVAALKLDDKGFIVRSEAPDGPDANMGTDLLLTLALRCRALAADIADTCKYETMSAWHEVLLTALLREPPPGYSKVSYKQLLNADQEVWRLTARLAGQTASAHQAVRTLPSKQLSRSSSAT